MKTKVCNEAIEVGISCLIQMLLNFGATLTQRNSLSRYYEYYFLQLMARQHLRFQEIANNVKNFNTCLVLFAIKECKPANYNEINV